MAYPEVPDLKPFKPCMVPNLMALGSYDEQLTTIENYLNTLGGYVDEQDEQLQEQIDGLDVRLTQAESDIDSLEGRMDTAESDIDALETRMDTAESDIDALETRMEAADASIADHEERLTAAEGNIGTLETRLDTAEGDIDALESRADSVETDIGELAGRMDTAEGDLDSLETALGEKLDKPEEEGSEGMVLGWGESKPVWVEQTGGDVSELESRVEIAEAEIEMWEQNLQRVEDMVITGGNGVESTGTIGAGAIVRGINASSESYGVVIFATDTDAAEYLAI